MPQSLAALVVLGANVQGLLPRHLAAMLQAQLPPHLIPWPDFQLSTIYFDCQV